MNLQKRFLFMFSILVATLAFSSGHASAKGEKIFRLTVGPSDRIFEDVPKLTLSNGPMAEEEKSLGVVFDKEVFSTFFADKVIQKGGVIYREARNYRDGVASFELEHVGGTFSSKAFGLDPDDPAQGVIEPSEFLVDVNVEVSATFDVYVCFTENNNCVFEKTSSKKWRAENGEGAFVEHDFQLLVRCPLGGSSFIEVYGSVDHPEIQRLAIDRITAQERLKITLGLITAIGDPVEHGSEFKGLKTFAKTVDGINTGIAEVTRKNDELHVTFSWGGFSTFVNAGSCTNSP